MDLQLSGKRALVSAGHKGIGKIVATRLLEEGASVSICCRRSDELYEALADLSSLGTALGQVRDMSDPDAVAAWVNWSTEALGDLVPPIFDLTKREERHVTD